MSASLLGNPLQLIEQGGFTILILLLCSLIAWAVIFERLWRYRRLNQDLRLFHSEATTTVLQTDSAHISDKLRALIAAHPRLPTAKLVETALDRLQARDARIRERWLEAVERKRQLLNQDLRQHLWILATIGSAAPFIGLFGTVVGILQSFQEIARTGAGGFTVVAAGISEALIATAAGIVVALIAVMAYNAFQTRWSALVLLIRIHAEELSEIIEATREADRGA